MPVAGELLTKFNGKCSCLKGVSTCFRQKVSLQGCLGKRNKESTFSFFALADNRYAIAVIRMANKNLNQAKNAKKDEFYTQLVDIENELKHYKVHFKNKTVLCNCDDPRVSNFFHYFSYNFEQLGLKKLITTCYKNQNRDLFSQNDSERAIWLEYYGDKNGNRVPDPEEIGIHYFEGDGDFRSKECIELLKEADIVVTNPPFSLFREYVAQLMKYEKKFVIVGHQNAIHYKEIFPLIKENRLWLGYGFKGGAAHFFSRYEDTATAGDHREGMIRVSGVNWFTNLEIPKRHEDLILYKSYNHEEYPKYDNFDAINVNKTSEIPMDYDGILGVPITFLDKYNPEQFEILGTSTMDMSKGAPYVAGKRIYERILIRRRQASQPQLYTQTEMPLPMAAEEPKAYNQNQ